jgi:hypothetical protein
MEAGIPSPVEIPEGHWDEDMFEYTPEHTAFGATLRCLSMACKKEVSLCGIVWADPVGDHYEGPADFGYDFEHRQYVGLYEPRCVLPAPRMLAIPEDCPSPVTSELRRIFALYWCDSAATANAIRTVVERLLDSEDIPRQRLVRKKYRRLRLNERSALLSKSIPDCTVSLTAIKWLGDRGSHGGILRDDELLDAMEILDYVLDALYGKRASRAAEARRRLEASRDGTRAHGCG